jgi:hypothetical protein
MATGNVDRVTKHHHRTFNRRSFLKHLGGAIGAVSTISVLKTQLPAGADTDGPVTATADDMNAAERYTVLQWNGPTNATIQLRQLKLLGLWSDWTSAPVWTDAQTNNTTLCHSGLIRTEGAHAVQARATSPGVTNLTIVRISGNAG